MSRDRRIGPEKFSPQPVSAAAPFVSKQNRPLMRAVCMKKHPLLDETDVFYSKERHRKSSAGTQSHFLKRKNQIVMPEKRIISPMANRYP